MARMSEPGVVVRARALRKLFGSAVAVDGIDFDVREGECFGLLGPNGAGKTTTSKMVTGVSPRTSGELDVLGQDIGRFGREVKRSLGVVPQEDNLDQDLTVAENLLVYARYFDMPKKMTRARIDELLSFFELTARAKARVDTLSGGMRRRLLIARGLIHEPRLLVLDEPTTGLDPQARHLLWERMRALRASGVTLMLTTHYMDEAEQLCDRLLIMDEGRIVAEGAPRALVRENVAPEVFEVRGPIETRRAVLEAVAESIASYEELEERLVLHAEHGDDVMHALAEHADLETLRRRATLEDVFLKLTGRRLVER